MDPLNSVIKCQESIILDGEIVVLGRNGMPSFQNHQRRMNVDNKADIEKLSQEMSATYFIFDNSLFGWKRFGEFRVCSKKEDPLKVKTKAQQRTNIRLLRKKRQRDF